MKRNKKLLILVGILAVCIIVYAVVSVVANKKEQADSSAATDEITVTAFSSSEVAVLRWNYEGEAYSLSLTDSYWYNDADKDFPVKQSYASTMCTQISAITASRKLENVENMAEYGLEDPYLEVSIMTATGGELSFIFGDTNAVSGECYMQYAEGDSFTESSDVYMVSSGIANAFSYAMADLIQFESVPDLSSINSIKIEAEETYRLSYMGDDVELPWVLRDADGNKQAANTDLCESIAYDLQYLSFVDCANYDAKTAELAAYGLDDPWVTVTVDYNTTSYTSDGSTETVSEDLVLYLGNVDENGNYYIMLDGYTMLYTIDDGIADFVKSNNMATLTDLGSLF